jgi:hypothetical protein
MRGISILLLLAVLLAAVPALAVENPLFGPSEATLARWVQRGFGLAEQEKPILADRRMAQCTWLQEPTGLMIGRPGMATGIRLVVLLTPEYIATLAGWAAAWDPAKWPAIQENPAEQAAVIAKKIVEHSEPDQLCIGLVVESPQESLFAFRSWVFGGGRWYGVQLEPWQVYGEAGAEVTPDAPSPLWAWQYTLWLASHDVSLCRPEGLRASLGRIYQNMARPGDRILEWVFGLDILRPEDIRVAFFDLTIAF